jgi:tyrosinase
VTAETSIAADAIVLRPSVERADLDALRDAYSQIQGFIASDNRSWIYWGEYHGFNRFDCWHHAKSGPPPERQYPYDLFLPWHRAYLNHFEHVVRERNPKAILPWWDWTSDLSHAEGIPGAYSVSETAGKPNPLASGPMPETPEGPARQTRRFPGKPARLPHADAPTPEPGEPTQPAINDLIENATTFEDFSTRLQDVHDFIHGWVGGLDPANSEIGGDMGNIGAAAFDPIFWAHHTMIDRVWYQWQLKHGVNNIPEHYGEKGLAPFGLTVQQVLDVRALGYDYASSAVVAAPDAAATGQAAAAAGTDPGGGA